MVNFRECAVYLSDETVPDVYPIDPRIDLGSDHVYNKNALLPRQFSTLALVGACWSREQDQKYPWTT